ncbi:hypothetical protein K449DRAFT_428923 [Hypoxylon sp. EC38]|nr:hypothetical protein K449DRAFT_428923 [Hypoxylon sp. EC38]
MPSLINSDLAAVSTGSGLYLYYQNDKSLHETYSADGKSWTASSTTVSDDLSDEGSPITAYYVKYDGSMDKKETIHVVYIDHQHTLREKAKVLSDGGEAQWVEIDVPDSLKKAPIETSTLASGVANDDTTYYSFQWVFFVESPPEEDIRVAGIIRNSKNGWVWEHAADLIEEPAAALPGTALANYVTTATSRVFLQDHKENLVQYNGGYGSWTSMLSSNPITYYLVSHESLTYTYTNLDKETIVSSDGVLISTPIAAASSNETEHPHVFYISRPTDSNTAAIQDYQGGTSTRIGGSYAPGSRLGAATLGCDTVYLFHKDTSSPLAISSEVFDGGSWKSNGTVVRSS